jgi:hypothetical protein
MGNVTDLPVNEQTSTNRQRETRSKAGPFSFFTRMKDMGSSKTAVDAFLFGAVF